MRVIFFCMILSGCADWSFGLVGKENTTSPQRLAQENSCIKDEQCADGNICIKQSDAYVGVCMRVVNKTNEQKR